MRFVQTRVDGCVRISIDANHDERGMFARVFCEEEFALAGLPIRFVQSSISRNLKTGTTRGLHFQLPPSSEGKLVRCIRGRIHDVVLDIRPNSESYLRHEGIELSADDCVAIYIPPGCAHGFQSLEDNSDVLYSMTDIFDPSLSGGLRWDDPGLDIMWPLDDVTMNERDSQYVALDQDWLKSLAWDGNDG